VKFLLVLCIVHQVLKYLPVRKDDGKKRICGFRNNVKARVRDRVKFRLKLELEIRVGNKG